MALDVDLDDVMGEIEEMHGEYASVSLPTAKALVAEVRRLRSAPIAAAASPAQAERVSEEDAGKRSADAFNLGLRTGAATALLTERHRIAARLRARADEEEKAAKRAADDGTLWRHGQHAGASAVLRAEADALEGT